MIRRLTVTDLRCLERVEIEPARGFNIIAGQNAQGKTSLLESIHLASTGRLLRASADRQAVREGCEEARVQAVVLPADTEVEVRLPRIGRRRALLNGLALPRASDLLGRLPSVEFSAPDLEIVRGEPAARRSFLDEETAQLSPACLNHLAGYRRALDQRNALLKQARETWLGAPVFEPWEERLVRHGNAIRQARRSFIDRLRPAAAAAHALLAREEALDLALEEADSGLEPALFHETRSGDIARGSTTVGPHRDDLSILVQGRDARRFASQGQQRTAVISLKLAVLELVAETYARPPILLLDDVFSDLDRHRREALVTRAHELESQTFITCTEAEQAGEELRRESALFLVQSGRVSVA
ncbi:MAG: DNA replication/repair protein RecF [Fimbriimonadaceae bacterium]|nr:DNA replication/repair protein RecF [Fimbriimonadaceae bacterium]